MTGLSFVPSRIFLTKGVGRHKEKLASFEAALRNARIAPFNLVKVSSIFPPHCKLVSVKAGLPHLHPGLSREKSEGIKTSWQRSTLLVLAITLHNIPEGMAVGVAFGAVAAGLPSATMGGAIALAIGIGLQNFPEGTAVSMPLRREGMSKRKSFFMGQASGMVEPVAGVLGALFVLHMQNILPYALCFAAGAMIFVVVEELIPESQKTPNHIDIVTLATMLGFTVMMILDVALG